MRSSKSSPRNGPPCCSERVLEFGEEDRLERVEARQRVVVQTHHVRLDGARLVVHAGDRVRMDLVAEVGLLRLAPGDDRVGERLQRRVVVRDGGVGGVRGEQPLGDRHRRRDQRRGTEHACVAQEVPARELESDRALHLRRLRFPRAK